MALPSVVPAPASIEADGSAPFALTSGTPIVAAAEITDATEALQSLIETRTGLRLDTREPADSAADARAIVLEIAGDGAAESYRLDVTEASVIVSGTDAAGLFYGVQTLGQLVEPAPGGWQIPAVRIVDAPRFAYRGVMLDVARHFHDVATVKAYIDRTSALKFNHLHLHLTDDQGWRLQLDSRPLLTEKASATPVGGDPGGFSTQDDYREVIDYAGARHMTVVPEIDLPGHTHAVSLAYPELSEEPVLSDHIREIVRDYGGELPVNRVPYDGMAVGFSSLKIRDEATNEFLADVLGEVARLTPGPYLHIGGDETLGTSAAEDYDYFIGRVSRLAASLGKTPVAWHEAGTATDLEPTTVGQFWGYVEPIDGMDAKARGFTAVGSDQGKLIDTLAFPRAAAAAEAAWSPAAGASELRTWESFAGRVGALAPLWTSQGIGFTPLDGIPWAVEVAAGADRGDA